MNEFVTVDALAVLRAYECWRAQHGRLAVAFMAKT
jgi:hypothetical protein